MKKISTLIVIAAITGCASAPVYIAPAIVDIAEDKVVVQRTVSNLPGNPFAAPNSATLSNVKGVANRGCKQYKRKAVLLSETCGVTAYSRVSNSNVCAATNYLFSCVVPE